MANLIAWQEGEEEKEEQGKVLLTIPEMRLYAR